MVRAGLFPIAASTLSALIWSITHAPFSNCHQSTWAERLVTCSDRSLLFPIPLAEKPADLKRRALPAERFKVTIGVECPADLFAKPIRGTNHFE